jgi:hypothetical protein
MTRLNRLVLLVLAAVLVAETSAFAQEREPLALRIELEWTLAGAVVGALIGTGLWLTDPANPNLSLSRQAIEGAALGTIVGAGFGLYILQRHAQFPAPFAQETSPILWGTGADPVAVRERAEALGASAPPNRPLLAFTAFRLRF